MRLTFLSSLQDFRIGAAEDHGLSPMATTCRHYRGLDTDCDLHRQRMNLGNIAASACGSRFPVPGISSKFFREKLLLLNAMRRTM